MGWAEKPIINNIRKQKGRIKSREDNTPKTNRQFSYIFFMNNMSTIAFDFKLHYSVTLVFQVSN